MCGAGTNGSVLFYGASKTRAAPIAGPGSNTPQSSRAPRATATRCIQRCPPSATRSAPPALGAKNFKPPRPPPRPSRPPPTTTSNTHRQTYTEAHPRTHARTRARARAAMLTSSVTENRTARLLLNPQRNDVSYILVCTAAYRRRHRQARGTRSRGDG